MQRGRAAAAVEPAAGRTATGRDTLLLTQLVPFGDIIDVECQFLTKHLSVGSRSPVNDATEAKGGDTKKGKLPNYCSFLLNL
jgi:hypothetical protein